MTILHKVYYNGTYVVARLEETTPSGLYIFGNESFDLNKEGLEERIKNREKLELDVSVERMALNLIRGHKDYRP